MFPSRATCGLTLDPPPFLYETHLFSERYHCITGMFFYLVQVIGMWSGRNHITLNALMGDFQKNEDFSFSDNNLNIK